MVSNINDAGVGSLRQAVLDANAIPGTDDIDFAPTMGGQTIVLATGQISVTDTLSINGPLSPPVWIHANFKSRLFHSDANLTISNLEMSSGSGFTFPTVDYGAIIYSTSDLTLDNCIIAGGSAKIAGGAIYHIGPSLNISNTAFDANSASSTGGGLGGAIYASGSVLIESSIFMQNLAANGGSGGDIYLSSGSLTLVSCQSRSGTAKYGGSIRALGPLTAVNCSFGGSGSTDAGAKGGALYLSAGGILKNCTVAYSGGSSIGGGIYGDVTLESTIVAKNTSSSAPDISGAVTAKNSLLGSSVGFTSFTDLGGNLPIGTDPLFRYTFGGLFQPLLPNSPCKNAGSNPEAMVYDVRGVGLARVVGTAADIGAFEIQPPPQVTFQLNAGSSQRSRVTVLSLTFRVDVQFLMQYRDLKRVSDNAAVTTTTIQTYYGAGYFTRSFSFTGAPVANGSLTDGVYRLTIIASALTDDSGQNLDGNGDGIGGDDFVSPTTPGNPNRIFRLFGDVDGDADVDAADFIQFRLSFGGSNFDFDFDGDGAVAASDFIQFRVRFGSMI